jgi:outer membrane protein assembly factor BamB
MMEVYIEKLWSLEVGVGPAEHGVYKFGYLWLSPTFKNQFWKVDPETGSILRTYSMPGNVWGAPWVDENHLYGASTEGSVKCFTHDGEVVWTVNPGLSEFIAEAITEAWGRYIAVQFPKGLAVIRKSDGEIKWCLEWSPESDAGQEPTFNPEMGLLWVCKPTVEGNLEAYDLNGRLTYRLTLPSPPTTYACPQMWRNLTAVVCRKDIVVVDQLTGRIAWSKRFEQVKYGNWQPDYPLAGGPRAITPDGRLIVWSADGTIYCFSIETGEELWRLSLVNLGYASRDCNDPWGYAGGVASDGVFIILGRNNLPASSGSPFEIMKNRLFIIDYFNGSILTVSEPQYQMACCCKPIAAGGRVVIGSWYKDSEDREYPARYYCWMLKSSEKRIIRNVDYEWLGSYHHGGYEVGVLLGV